MPSIKVAKTEAVRVEPLVRLIDEAIESSLSLTAKAPSVIREAMRYCLFPSGKRFRPLLCLATAEATGQSARRAIPIAVAIELIHSYSLVHDDLPAMDNADHRRGKPSCHRRFGEAIAILAGDALLTLAFEILSHLRLSKAQEIARVIAESSGASGLIAGQALDLALIQQPEDASPSLLRQIAQKKTTALILASVLSGALSGQASASEMARFRRYGQKLGLAFQLIDDVHDHDGLARILGEKTAAEEAEQLIQQAVSAIRPFGSRAEALRGLALWLRQTLHQS
ncbi:MAG: polyprenyl synthetase family protein [Candidatus Omnitrophica bacterium]|nr:polyprenyl synthetase family protein [Candidatus Omnitrophota bacterium]MBI3010195.1 polyprenyl synthetase family protein [Candidatus Omnitrophota bacterium]